ncbi:hypothetical protein T12_11578 [Trichinella patagoniensis]|uniref:Uncharacterized protein n=1 Tax=Trichinella patagoniensis TaxID=990121 RepID=A0A0V1ACX9_9BILA|nr:hypothetical protein T12_11578 [Trichinella patagoniensis]
MLLGPQYSQYVRSGGTANVTFPQILATALHIPHRCLVSLRHCMQTARNNITDRLLICIVNIIGVFLHASLPEVEGLSFMHYVFTQIFCYSHALLDCASMKAEILHFQTCPDRLISLEQASGIA